ncbi:MAG: hypothetical protein ACR2RB_07500 [Gammaproteobacteria bacterium]
MAMTIPHWIVLVVPAVFVFTFSAVSFAKTVRQKIGVGLASLPVYGIIFAGFVEALGLPKPSHLEVLRHVETATLVAYHFNEPTAIDVWLLLPGERRPVAYNYPWSTATAQAIQTAARDAQKTGTSVEVSKPFEHDAGASFSVHPRPPRESPPKPVAVVRP